MTATIKQPRLTFAVRAVLAVLSNPPGERYGREIIKAVTVAPKRGYTTLLRLELAGWITSYLEDIDEAREGRRKRRYYRLTDLGKDIAEAVNTETKRLLLPGAP